MHPKPLNSSRVQGLLLAARLEGSHEKSSAWVQDRLAPDPCKPYIGGQVRSSGLTINLTPTHRRCGRLAANSSASSEPGALLMPFTPKLARLALPLCAAALTAGCVTNPASRACAPNETNMVNDQIFLGTDTPSGPVSPQEWTSFLAESVTPRFPQADGLAGVRPVARQRRRDRARAVLCAEPGASGRCCQRGGGARHPDGVSDALPAGGDVAGAAGGLRVVLSSGGPCGDRPVTALADVTSAQHAAVIIADLVRSSC